MPRYERSLVALSPEFLNSATVRRVLAVTDEQLQTAQRNGEVAIEAAAVDTSSLFGPTFTVGNIEVTVAWTMVRTIIRIADKDTSKDRPKSSPASSRGGSESGGSWMT